MSDQKTIDLNKSFIRYLKVVQNEGLPFDKTFNNDHLKNIHAYIFQDSSIKNEIKPGEFRNQVPDDKNWLKTRHIVSLGATYPVSYSRLNEQDKRDLDNTLKEFSPEKLKGMTKADFAESIANLYGKADFIHPFMDGNSRTLRAYTTVLAKESGFDLDWSKTDGQQFDRDCLYIARDKAVLPQAIPIASNEHLMKALSQASFDLTTFADLRTQISQFTRELEKERFSIAYRWTGEGNKFHLLINEKPAPDFLQSRPDVLDVLSKNKFLGQFPKEQILSGIIDETNKGIARHAVIDSTGKEVEKKQTISTNTQEKQIDR